MHLYTIFNTISYMRKIVAIGGGELKDLETLKIDKEIVRLTGKKHPKALLIPTASSDEESYWEVFQKAYGKKLGCKTDVLYLIKDTLTKKQIKNKILSSDIIYVGGGNTLKMMKVWRRLDVDKLLKTAYNNGTVLSGISAGAICWFAYGHSDSMSYYNPKQWDYIRVKGIGIIGAFACPHYDRETLGVKRKKDFQKMFKKVGGLGIGIDNHCAIEFINNKYKLITSRKDARAYKVYKRRGKIVTEIIEQKKELTPITTLLKK